MSQASVAQEFYKIRNKWATIDQKKWNMAIWVCDYADLDIINQFMNIEASPIGVFDDIFFQFQSIYNNDEDFEKKLWAEFLSWFQIGEDKKYDMIGALKKDRYLPESYQVNKNLPATFESVMAELLRLKSFLPFDENNFILYFLPSVHQNGYEEWLLTKLQKGLPKDIRLAALDLKEQPKLGYLRKQKEARVVELTIKLDMNSAIRNEMDKDSTGGKANAPAARFQKQVRVVMDATVDKDLSIKNEASKLVEIGQQMNKLNIIATTHMVNATAFYSLKMKEEAMESVDIAIEITEAKFDELEEAYSIWRSAIMIKAALLMAEKKKQKESMVCYQKMADEATKRGDAFYAMEGYRMKAFIYYHQKKLEEAWGDVIFSLQAGTNLEMDFIRSSTFLFSAALALQIARAKNDEDEVFKQLEKRYNQYIGEDWQMLLKDIDVTKKKVKPPKPAKV